jgi:hypothetical protein
METSVTFFHNLYDNKTSKRIDFENFDRFSKFLYKLSNRPLMGKKDAELMSPAVYHNESTRSNKGVLGWAGWAAVDIDDWKNDGSLKDKIDSKLRDWKYVCYSTASSKIDHPKFRLVFELSRFLVGEEIRHFWFALQSVLDDAGDKQCKDLSRMYYIPATYLNASNFFFGRPGDPVDIDALLQEFPYDERKTSRNFMDRLPDEMQRKLIQYRMDSMGSTSYSWNTYLDCPFVNKRLISDYRAIAYTDNSGRYAMIYKIMASISVSAIKKEYPISSNEIVDLVRQLDRDTSNRYEDRSLQVEADRALEYAYRNV